MEHMVQTCTYTRGEKSDMNWNNSLMSLIDTCSQQRLQNTDNKFSDYVLFKFSDYLLFKLVFLVPFFSLEKLVGIIISVC